MTSLLIAAAAPVSAQTLTPFDAGSVERYTATDFSAAPPGLPAPVVSDTLVHDPASAAMSLVHLSQQNCQACLVDYQSFSHAYAFFDVPADLDNIATVTLTFQLLVGSTGMPGTAGPFPWQAWSVESPAADYTVAYAGDTTPDGLALFSDLASGTPYGSGSAQEGGQVVTLTFEGAARADVLAARGSVFGVGFTTPSMTRALYGVVTGSLTDIRLVVTTIPEPGTGALMWLALGVLPVALKRRTPARHQPDAATPG